MATREQILRSRQLDIKLALRRRLLLEGEESAGPGLPVEATHVLTVGSGAANQYGFDSGYGALDPSTDQATTVQTLATSGTNLRLDFAGGASPYGNNEVTAEVRIYIEGAPSTFYDLTWSAGFAQEYRYALPDTDLIDYMATQVGNDLEVAIGAVP